MLSELKRQVLEANLLLPRHFLRRLRFLVRLLTAHRRQLP